MSIHGALTEPTSDYRRRAEQHRPACSIALAAEIRRQHRENGLSVVGISEALKIAPAVVRAALGEPIGKGSEGVRPALASHSQGKCHVS